MAISEVKNWIEELYLKIAHYKTPSKITLNTCDTRNSKKYLLVSVLASLLRYDALATRAALQAMRKPEMLNSFF